MELYRARAGTTVVDVGVTDAPFGVGLDATTSSRRSTRGPSGSRPSGTPELDRFAAAFPRVRVVQADGRALPFGDGEFDLGFSNAVVEHVAGGREGQRAVRRASSAASRSACS